MSLRLNNDYKRVLEYKVPENKPFLVFETYSSKKSKSRIIHVLNFTYTNTIKVGRGQEANVRITDISVSRCHSEITFKDGKFYQYDLGSKFGTLRSFSEPIKLRKSLNLQAGKTVLFFDICKHNRCCCFDNKSKAITSYVDYEMACKRFPKELKVFFGYEKEHAPKRRKYNLKDAENFILQNDEKKEESKGLNRDNIMEGEHVDTEIADNNLSDK